MNFTYSNMETNSALKPSKSEGKSLWIWVLIGVSILGLIFALYYFVTNWDKGSENKNSNSSAKDYSTALKNLYTKFKSENYKVQMDMVRYFHTFGEDPTSLETLDTYYFYKDGNLSAQTINADPDTYIFYNADKSRTFVINSTKTYGPVTAESESLFPVPGDDNYDQLNIYYDLLLKNGSNATKLSNLEYEIDAEIVLPYTITEATEDESVKTEYEEEYTFKYTFDANGNLIKVEAGRQESGLKDLTVTFEYTKLGDEELKTVLTIPDDYKESIQ